MRGRGESSRNGLPPLASRTRRIVPHQRPVPGVDRAILLVEALAHVDAVGDAVAVGDDQGRPVVRLSLAEGAERLLRVGAHRHAGHVDVAVGDRLQRQVLLGRGLAGRRELRHRAERRRLGRLAAGVGVDLGVEHQHVDVTPAGAARGRGRRSRCRRPSRHRRRSTRCAAPGGRPRCAGPRAAGPLDAVEPTPSSSATRSRWAGCSNSRTWSASRIAVGQLRRRPRRAARAGGCGPGRCAGRRRAAGRGRTRRCPRTASSTRPARARRRCLIHGVVGRLPP